MKTAEISVVIATYNRLDCLPAAISSALAQEGVTVEVIVIEDGERPMAQALVEGVNDSRVRYIARGRASGGKPAIVRNEGLEVTRYPLVHFLDDDDQLSPGALAAMAEVLERDNVGMVFGRLNCFGPSDKANSEQNAYYARGAERARRIKSMHDYASMLLFSHTPVITSVCLARREALRAMGGFDANLRVCEDVDLFLQVGRAHGASFLDRVVLEHRVGAKSITTDLGANEAAIARETYAQIHAHYKKRFGTAEFLTLKVRNKIFR